MNYEEKEKIMKKSNKKILRLKNELKKEYDKTKEIRKTYSSYLYKKKNKGLKRCVDCGDKLRKDDGIRCVYCTQSHNVSNLNWRNKVANTRSYKK